MHLPRKKTLIQVPGVLALAVFLAVPAMAQRSSTTDPATTTGQVLGELVLESAESDMSKRDFGRFILNQTIRVLKEREGIDLPIEADPEPSEQEREREKTSRDKSKDKHKGNGPPAHARAHERSAVWGNKDKDNLGAFVQRKLEDGLRGEALADAIHEEIGRVDEDVARGGSDRQPREQNDDRDDRHGERENRENHKTQRGKH